MDNQKFNLILDKLLEKTERGKLVWETTADKDTFLVVLEDSSISVSQAFERVTDYMRIKFFTFDFRNENGEIADSVSISKSVDEDEKFEKAGKIYDLARQQSVKSDKTVDRILEQLAA